MIRGMRALRLCPGFLAAVLLLGIGVGLVSVTLPDEPGNSGYYDGDGDDAVAVSERRTMVIDLAVGDGAAILPAWRVEALDVTAAPLGPRTPGRSQPPLLRSPPSA
jgi:hypothetical protein